MLFWHYTAIGQGVEPDTSEVVPLGPIVVTALRTPFLLTEAPYAVAVNGPDEIRRGKAGLGLNEALFAVPGVQVDNRFNYAQGERVMIRGFGARAQFGVRGVRLLLDGIPATLPDGQTALNNIDVGALERAEVIRGPASALYGNAAGGVILLESKRPPYVPFSQEFSVTGGRHGMLRMESTTAGRKGDTWYSLNLSRLAYDGYRSFNESKNFYLNARVGREHSSGAWNVTANIVDYDAQNPGALSDSLLRIDRTRAYAFNVVQKTGEKGRQGQIGGRWSHNFKPGSLELSGYGIGRRIDNPIPPRIIDLERLAGGIRARFAANPLRRLLDLRWTAGVELDLQRDDRQNYANLEGARGELVLDQVETVRNAAVYAQVTTQPASRLLLVGGLRYDYFEFAADDRFVNAGDPDDSGSRRMDAFSPSAGFTYSFSEALNIYGNVSTSFETPTTTELANRPSGAGGFNPELEPQETLSFELGAKGQVGGALAFQVAAFHAAIDHSLIPFEVPDVPGRQFFRNAGSAVHRGFEAGVGWAPVDGLKTRFAYTFVDARFDSYRVEDAVYDGHEVPGIAPHRLEAGVTYEGPGGWFVSAEGRYSGKMAVNDENTAYAEAYAVLDLTGGIEDLEVGGVRLALFAGVTNALDTTYNTSVVINAFGGRFYEPGPGRAFYLGIKLGL